MYPTQTVPAFVDSEGRIFSQNGYQQTQIGYSVAKYEELQKLATEAVEKASTYKQQLIDAGLISVPLTTEEQLAALTKQVATLAEQNASLSEKVSTLAELLTVPKAEAKKAGK